MMNGDGVMNRCWLVDDRRRGRSVGSNDRAYRVRLVLSS